MAQCSPSFSVIPLEWIESSKAVDFDITGQIGVTQNIVSCHVQLLRALSWIAEEDHCWSFDIIVIFQIKFKFEFSNSIFEGMNPIVDVQ